MFISDELKVTNLYEWAGYLQDHLNRLQHESPDAKLVAADFNGVGFWINDLIAKLDVFGNADLISYLANVKDRLETLYANLSFVSIPQQPNVMYKQHHRFMQIVRDVQYILQFLKRQVNLQFKKLFEMGSVDVIKHLQQPLPALQITPRLVVRFNYNANFMTGYAILDDLQFNFDPQLKRLNKRP